MMHDRAQAPLIGEISSARQARPPVMPSVAAPSIAAEAGNQGPDRVGREGDEEGLGDLPPADKDEARAAADANPP